MKMWYVVKRDGLEYKLINEHGNKAWISAKTLINWIKAGWVN